MPSTPDCGWEGSITAVVCGATSDFAVDVRGFRFRNGSQSKNELVISLSCSIGSGADFDTSATPYDFERFNGGRILRVKFKYRVSRCYVKEMT